MAQRIAAVRIAQSAATGDDRVLENLGNDLFGPLFAGLMQWIVARVQDRPVDAVFFCARDGMFLKRLYEIAAERTALPPARYLEVSRRAIVFPTFREIDETALDFLTSNDAAIEAREYVSRIGLDITAFSDALAAVGLAPETRIFEVEERAKIRRFLAMIGPHVLARAAEERPLLVDYFRQLGLFEMQHVAFVDIGWGGTMQRAFARAMRERGHPLEIDGYYFSTDRRTEKMLPADGTSSAWFTSVGQPRERQRYIEWAYWLLEIAFSAQHGTVIGYQGTTQGVVPVHHSFDPSSRNARAAHAIQEAAFAFFRTWLEIFDGLGPALSPEMIFARYRRFVDRPTNAEARFFGDLVHVGGLGATTEEQPLAAPPSLRSTLRKPKEFVTRYRESRWQLGFVQRVVRSNAFARLLLGARDRLRGDHDARLLRPQQFDARARRGA